MEVLFAVALGLLILAFGFGTLRGFSRQPPGGSSRPEPTTPPPNVRILFWCENCGTEVLLLRQGSAAPLRHCGEPMIRREEVPWN